MSLTTATTSSLPANDPAEPISARYLLISGIHCHVDGEGRRWTDPLWHKDLVEHVRYLRNFTLASPARRDDPPAGAVCLTDDGRFANVQYVDLPCSGTTVAGLRNWPKTFHAIWRAIGEADIVHAGVADWPIPTGWSATLAARLRRRLLIINIESAFWRVPPGAKASLQRRLRARLWEAANRWCVNRADVPLFTQEAYARELLADPLRGHVFHASWIDEDVVVDESAATTNWDAKQNAHLAILFAGRLTPAKGVLDLLEAMAQLSRAGLPVRLDVIGDGELAPAVKDAANTLHGPAAIRLLPTVPYGPEFFNLVRNYHAVVVPCKSDEQPRIVYDAYSQAVPILGTTTPGLTACVQQNETGWLVEPSNPEALAELFRRADAGREDLRRMGLRSRFTACSYTHREMHRRRWRLLAEILRDN